MIRHQDIQDWPNIFVPDLSTAILDEKQRLQLKCDILEPRLLLKRIIIHCFADNMTPADLEIAWKEIRKLE